MRFSVVTSCGKVDERLHRTARSILRQSTFQRGRSELQYVIVTCDTSDAAGRELEHYRSQGVKCIQEPDETMYDGLAKGLRRADGDVVSYLNAGDLYHEEAFAILESVFAMDGPEWVTGYSALCNPACQIIGTWKPARFDRMLFPCGAYCSSRPRQPWVQQESTFWSRKLNAALDLDKLATFRLAGDHYMWLTFSRLAQLYSIHGVLGAFLLHEDQLSSDREAYFAEIEPHLQNPNLTQAARMALEFRCPWALKYRIEKLLPPRERLEIHFDVEKDCWELR